MILLARDVARTSTATPIPSVVDERCTRLAASALGTRPDPDQRVAAHPRGGYTPHRASHESVRPALARRRAGAPLGLTPGPAATADSGFGSAICRAWPTLARSAPTNPAVLRRWMGACQVPR